MNNSQPATKADLSNLENRIDKKFDQFGKQIIDVIDSFRTEFRSEILTLKNDLKDIKERLTLVEKRTLEDVDAVAKEVVLLRKDFKSIDKRLTKIETQRA